MDNRDYARILQEIAALLQIKGANPFRIRAYDNAANTVRSAPRPMEELIDQGELTDLKGIGDGIAAEIGEIRQTGTSDHHRQLLDELDPGLLDLLEIQGLGPKRIKKIYEQLGVSDLDELRLAAEQGTIQTLSGFGAKTEQKILDEIDRLDRRAGRIPLPRARGIGESIREELAEIDGVERIELAGSVRRQRETIGDVDLLVATDDPAPIHQAIGDLVEVDEVLVTGDTKTSVRLHNGIQVDVRTVEPNLFGSALHYFTGSKQHHVQLRSQAKRQGFKISEYGIFRNGESTPVASRTERELFEVLQLDYIPPELREGGDEIDRAADGALPALIEPGDVRGDLHMHTTETDGRASIEQMARAAIDRGYDYIAITDHSQAVRVANGMNPDRFAAQIDQIRQVDDQIEEIRILSGIEVDILKDGSLDMDHDLLERCDWIVASVHSHFNLDSESMTDRLIDALQTGLISSLGHPTGRILGGRDGYDYDFDAVVDAAVEHNTALEINGSSGRLDLNAELAARAAARGARIVLGSDAHSRQGLDEIRYAVGQARRAGLESGDVINCHGVERLIEG